MKLVKRLKEICSDKKEAAYCSALLFIMLFGLGFSAKLSALVF